MEQREVEIDLIDFMYDVLSHWRGLIACILIGALLGGGYSYVKSAATVPAETVEVTAEIYEEQLTEIEVTDVNTLIRYDQLLSAYANDSIMQLDASNVAEGSMILSVATSGSKNAGEIAETATRLLSSTEFYSYIAKKENYTGDVSQLFWNNITKDSKSDTIALQYALAGASDDDSTYGTVEIRFFGESEEFCANVLQDTQAYLEEKETMLTGLYGEYSIEVLSESVDTVAESRVASMQTEKMTAYKTNKTERDTLEKSFSDVQRAYYTLLTAEEDANADVASEAEVVAKPQVSKKMIALGAIGLLFLYGIYLFMAYAFNGKWQNHSSYQEIYGLTDLGTIRKTGAKQKRGLDAMIARGRLRGMKELSVEEAVDTLSSTIALQTEKEKINTLAFVGGNYGEETESQMKALAEALQKKNADISVKTLYDVSYNATAIDQLAGVDAVVIVETAAKSRISEMTKEILLLTNQKIRILGGVTI